MEKIISKLMLFDLDGTIYLDGVLYPGARELIARLKDSPLRFGFLTNNSSIGPADYVEKLNRLGLDIGPENMVSSCEASASMLKKLGVGPEIYILGTRKFIDYMESQGFVHTFEGAKALLVGFDKELTYDKMHKATILALNGLPVYASHPDPVCPPQLPDAGMLLEWIKAASPKIKISGIAGKPYHWMAEYIEDRFNVKSEEVIMVGDRPGTDIRFGCSFNMRTMMVLNDAPMPDLPPDVKPTCIVPKIGMVLNEYWPGNLGWI